MMAPVAVPADLPVAVHIALLADIDPHERTHDRVHAVLAWTDGGDRHYQPLHPHHGHRGTGCQGATSPRRLADLNARPDAAGHSWRTWTLASVPADLRHLPPAAVTQALAAQLAA